MATGDGTTAVPVLAEVVRPLAEGVHRPVMLPTVRYLARMGRAAGPAARLLRGVPGDDRRLRSGGGWRGFTEDEDVRTAVGALLTATGEGGEDGPPG
ncbi:hypothetical protein [Streptomyces sp. NPDC046887]|uniref:hypothetical protein n=1 Tax=Streptomyces sp. NPDC046887 TaxID=3155472 RepID=UPI0033F4A18A